MDYIIKRGVTGVTVATITPNGQQTKKVMGENTVSVTFTLSVKVDFEINDYVTVYGEKYILNTLPVLNKKSGIEYVYTCEFQAVSYQLAKVEFLTKDNDDDYTIADFAIMANADMIVDLVIQNANRDQSGWVKGTVDATEYRLLSFSNKKCLTVLSDLASEFNIEFWIEGQTVHMTKRGVVEALNFEVGQGKGFYEITRTQANDRDIITRLYAYGSSRNLPTDYKNYSSVGGATPRLKLPGATPFIENNIWIGNNPVNGVKYGVSEESINFDDIYPTRTGTLSAVDVTGLIIADSTIDFNLNSYVLPGVTAKIVFTTGDLSGYQFDIGKYDHATKTITLKAYNDGNGFVLPSATILPAIGDQYKFIDIALPQSYIDAAEALLLTKAQAFLTENSSPVLTYSVVCDIINFIQRAITIVLGNYVHVADADFNLNENIRIIGFTRDLQIPQKYSLDLANVVAIAAIVRSYQQYEQVVKAISVNRLTDLNRTRMNWKTTQELRNMIYDPDGYFDGTNIRPNSIETLMLSVGAKSQQFILSGITFEPNFTGDNTKFNVTGGKLIQFSLFTDPYTWNIGSVLISGLDNTKSYYIYAKCSKSANTGTIELSETAIKTEEIAGYYMFWIGALHSVIDDVRGISLTYGQTTINGRFITTGRIQSADGYTYFDLDAGLISGKITFQSGSSGYDNITDKPDLSIYAVESFVTAALIDLQSQIDGEITTWFYDYEPTLSNEPALSWTDTDTKNKHLGDLFYSSVTGYAYRFNLVSGVYSWVRIADTDITLALANAAAAQDTADHKRRVFITTPTTPYDVGDLWAGGSAADIKRCIVSRATGAYNAADWDLASKYTDDTAANAAQAAADAAQDAADSAQYDADAANNKLADIANDNILTKYEKADVLKEWQVIQGEKSIIDAQADTYGITRTAYDGKYDDLDDYITPLLADLTTDNAIVGATFRAAFSYYYTAKTTLLKNVSDAAKEIADDLAASLGDMAYADAVELAMLGTTVIEGGFIKTDLIDVDTLYVKNLKTADSGQRVHIDGAANNIRFFNSADEVVVLIDDDAAIVGYTIDPDPPYGPIPIYGPGVMIGDIGDDYLSLAKNGIRTSGTIDAESLTINDLVSGKLFKSGVFIGDGSLPSDGLILATGNCNLYTTPYNGQIQRVRNNTSGNITINAADTTGSRFIVGNDGTPLDYYVMPGYGFHTFIYIQSLNIWLKMY